MQEANTQEGRKKGEARKNIMLTMMISYLFFISNIFYICLMGGVTDIKGRVNIKGGNNVGVNRMGVRYYSSRMDNLYALDRSYYIGGILTNHLFNESFDHYWNTVLVDQGDDCFFGTLVKIRTEEGFSYSISKMQLYSLSTGQALVSSVFQQYWSLKSEEYHTLFVDSLLFSTFRYSGNQAKLMKTRLIEPRVFHDTSWVYKGFKLPNSSNFLSWGVGTFIRENLVNIITENNSLFVIRSQSLYTYEVSVMVGNKVALQFRDVIEEGNNDSGSFRRIMLDSLASFRFVGGKIVESQVPIKSHFLKSLPEQKVFNPYIVTVDLEAYNGKDGELVPYCGAIYDGHSTDIFYLCDFMGWSDMLAALVNCLFQPRFLEANVYIHNFSRFDGVYLLRVLANSATLSITYRNGVIFSILVSKGQHKFTIFDSLLLLPSSLASLSVSFGTSVVKGIFPYSFATYDSLNYVGPVPAQHYYNCDSATYNEYCKDFGDN